MLHAALVPAPAHEKRAVHEMVERADAQLRAGTTDAKMNRPRLTGDSGRRVLQPQGRFTIG
jgi:hypothetical protein